MRFGTRARLVAGLGTLVLAFGLGRATARGKDDSTIVGVFGVGGVLSQSGNLWQYLPDEKRWMSIDDSFMRSKKETHILPLPVAVKDIKFMQSWGFIVTTQGRAWLYDLDTNAWKDIGTP